MRRPFHKRINELSFKLANERPQNPSYQDQYAPFDPIPHLFSNANFVLPMLQKLEQREAMNPTHNNVAILLGESFGTSILPILLKSNIQTVIFVDRNPLILDHLQFMMNCMEKCETLDKFYHAYLEETQNPALTTPIHYKKFTTMDLSQTQMAEVHLDSPQKLDIRMLGKFLNNHKILLGDSFFGSSENRYQLCRAALRKLEICYLNIDLLSITEAEQFSEVLREEQCQVQLMNITNLHEYDSDTCALRAINSDTHDDWKMRGQLFKAIEIIVGDNQKSCWFMFAHMSRESNFKTLYMNQAVSLDNLKERIHAEVNFLLTTQFEPALSKREAILKLLLLATDTKDNLAVRGLQGLLLSYANPKGQYEGHSVRCFTIKPLINQNPDAEIKQEAASIVHASLRSYGFFCTILNTKNGNPSVTIDLNRSHPKTPK